MQTLCNQNENCRGFDLDGYLYSKISYPLNKNKANSSTLFMITNMVKPDYVSYKMTDIIPDSIQNANSFSVMFSNGAPILNQVRVTCVFSFSLTRCYLTDGRTKISGHAGGGCGSHFTLSHLVWTL